MGLNHDLISQFAKVINKDKKQSSEATVYGTIRTDDKGNKYVQLDGSDQLTPLTDPEDLSINFMSATANENDRVSVLIKDHTATVTGNLSHPATNSADVADQIDKFNTIIVDQVNANSASINKLQTDKADVGELQAAEAKITKLETEKASIEDLNATNASIENLNTVYANIDFTNIDKATMGYFYAQSGLIKDVVVGDQTITGKLVGVTISGDLLEGNTVVAEKLVIKGSDGLYYKLNTDGMKVEAQQTDYNSINGQVIKAKSITATKISVSDLVAFDATIGGFNITDNSLYSGVKESVDNTTRGIYLDKDGQMAIGDSNNYFKYYRDTDGVYRLALAVDSISINGGTIDGLEIGGRNYALYTSNSWSNECTVSGWQNYRYSGSEASFIDLVGQTVTFSGYINNLSGAKVGIMLHIDTPDLDIGYWQYTSTSTIAAGNTGFISKTVAVPSDITTITGVRLALRHYSADVPDTVAKIRSWKLEKGNKATDWTPAPEDVDSSVNAAAKTATNFVSYDSTNGLQLGNNTSGSWNGFRTQITGSAFNILNAAGAAIASYGAKLIELGKSATDAVIKFCGGKGQINYDDTDDCLQLTADNVRLKGTEMASLYSNYTDGNGIFRNGAVHASPGSVQVTAGGGSDNSNIHVNPTNIQMSTKNFYLAGVLNDSTNGGVYVAVNDGTSGIWTFRQYSNGMVELWGTYNVSNLDCTTAMGSMYRTAVFNPTAFPFTVYNPNLTASYESDGYGAFLWATTTTTTAKPPSYYLVRATSATIVKGEINFHVYGKWKQ